MARFGEPRPPKRVRRSNENPLVYLEIKRGNELLGKVVLELFKDTVPKVCTEFRLSERFFCKKETEGTGRTKGSV